MAQASIRLLPLSMVRKMHPMRQPDGILQKLTEIPDEARPFNIESAPGYFAGEIQGFLTPRFREYLITFWRKSGTFEVQER